MTRVAAAATTTTMTTVAVLAVAATATTTITRVHKTGSKIRLRSLTYIPVVHDIT